MSNDPKEPNYRDHERPRDRRNLWLYVIVPIVFTAVALLIMNRLSNREQATGYSVLDSSDWVETNSQKGNFPSADTTFLVDSQLYRFEDIKGKLDQLPDYETLAKGDVFIVLPFENTFVKFKILPSMVMSPELKEKFPSIKAYKGIAVNDPSITANFTSSDNALYVMISSPDVNEYINTQKDNPKFLIKSRRPANFIPSSLSEALMSERKSAGFDSILAVREFLITRRTFRIAVAATGEYTRFHGGKINAMTAIITTIGNVNTTYESELGISFTLVGGNGDLLFDNPDRDNLSNDKPEVLVLENQLLIDKIIGNGNYDLGHVFSTSSGFAPGLLCDPAAKAQGTSGLLNPIGSPFDIDYVAHEIGHQLGANHIFNGSTCPNRNRDTAVEPGSGSTIMGYAGICKEQDLQSNSDKYFNALSLYEIDRFIQGITCGTSVTTPNHNPLARAAKPLINVPVKTPFFLVGFGTDRDNDTLRYTWEQNDVTNDLATAPQFESTTTPNYRSRPPSIHGIRYFPNMEDNVNGEIRIGEIIPKQERDIHFILTVRDNKGGFDFDQTTVHIQKGADFKITSPTLPAAWKSGSRQTVKWDVAKTDKVPFLCEKVNILMSTDGGKSFPLILASDSKNDGKEEITVPPVGSTSQVCIKIEAIGQQFFAVTEQKLQIDP